MSRKSSTQLTSGLQLPVSSRRKQQPHEPQLVAPLVIPTLPQMTLPTIDSMDIAHHKTLDAEDVQEESYQPPKKASKISEKSDKIPPIKKSPKKKKEDTMIEMKTNNMEVTKYKDIINNSSIDRELLNNSYIPTNKIVIQTDNGEKRTQYIKSINKNGQKVFISIDMNGYTTSKPTDLTLVQTSNNNIPHSLKTGATNCVGTDVSGVAFECNDYVCVITRNGLDFKEENYCYVQDQQENIMSGVVTCYPVVKLSEIKANPDMILTNTDKTTRRLRNASYTSELQDLELTSQAIIKLNNAFVTFDKIKEESLNKLTGSLNQLEKWNGMYVTKPPATDDTKDKYKRLQYNLAKRNEGIDNLLKCMRKVSELRFDIEEIAKDIEDISEFCVTEFQNMDQVIAE
jgi:hypothetical protein